MSTIALTEEMSTAVVAEGMTKYEKFSIVLAIAALVFSVLVPLIQWIYREKRKAVLKYYPTGHAFAYCNLSGSYIRIDGVFEALKRAISLKKVSISIVRKKDEKKLNLEWLKFYSPSTQSFMGLQAFAEELAHPFRIDADHVACAFIEFSDPNDSAGKTIRPLYNNLLEECNKIKVEESDFYKAKKLLVSADSYRIFKDTIKQELFWEIGEYQVTVIAHYEEKDVNFTVKTSVSETQYGQFLAGIDELCLIHLKSLYGVKGNYQPVQLDLKDAK